MSPALLGEGPAEPVCSRSGCRATATWRVDWRNPRIHAEGRTKTWLACDEHRDVLAGFLTSRSFPTEVSAFSEAEESA